MNMHKLTIGSIVNPHAFIMISKVTHPKYDATKGNVIKALICRTCDVEINLNVKQADQ